jgi:hypothetical protein
MAVVMMEADLTEVSGFPVGEELCHLEDLVMCYGPAREAVAAQVPVAEVLARLPLIRVFSCFALLVARQRLLFCNGPLMMNQSVFSFIALVYMFKLACGWYKTSPEHHRWQVWRGSLRGRNRS